jgi:hypothetical protein
MSCQHMCRRVLALQTTAWSPANFTAGPTTKLEHVAERFSAFYSDLEQEKQVCGGQLHWNSVWGSCGSQC